MAQVNGIGGRRAGDPEPPWPEHVITLEQVQGWLAGSAVQEITIHRTDAESAQSIREHGFLLEQASPTTGWGRAFYSGSRSDPQYGPVEVRVAVRLVRPLVIADAIRDVEVIEELVTRAGTDDIRVAVLAAGYDGVVVQYGLGDYWVVAYYPDQVKVVVEE